MLYISLFKDVSSAPNSTPVLYVRGVSHRKYELTNRMSILVPRSHHGNWSCLHIEEEQSSSSSYMIGIVVLHCKTGGFRPTVPEPLTLVWGSLSHVFALVRDTEGANAYQGDIFQSREWERLESTSEQHELCEQSRSRHCSAHDFAVCPMDKSFCPADVCAGPLKNAFVFVSSERSVTQIPTSQIRKMTLIG